MLRRIAVVTAVAVAYLIANAANVADASALREYLVADPEARCPRTTAPDSDPYAIYDDYPSCRCRVSPDHYAIFMDCSSSGLNDTLFTRHHYLPAFTTRVDMSNNRLGDAPELIGPALLRFDLSHNHIRRLYDNVFAGVGAIEELALAWNQIDQISIAAFAGLGRLRRLDLTKNHLRRLANNVFSPLPMLGWLDMSRNRELSESFVAGPAGAFSVYLTWGVSTRLRTLRLEECGLHELRLADGVGLEELFLKYNRLERVPDVPRGVRVLDLSGNPIEELETRSLPLLGVLQTLYMQDMPNLTTVGEFAMVGAPQLRVFSLTGSWRLRKFASTAFGWSSANGTTGGSSLTDLDLSGTALVGVNLTATARTKLADMMETMNIVDLSGAPVQCSCELRELLVARSGRLLSGECAQPADMRGRKLSGVLVEELGCRRWAGWVYQVLNGLAILAMLAVCVTATWCLVTHIRPKSRRDRLQKVGDSSPYARVTIEPTRGEM